MERWTYRDINGVAHIRAELTPKEMARHGAIQKLAEYEDAEAEGRLVVTKVAIGDKVHDTLADYDFEIQKIEIYPGEKIVYRCGNEGTNDYAAFHDYEYGERFTREEAERALFGPCHDCKWGDDRFDNPCSCPVACKNHNQYEAALKESDKG